MDNVLFENYHRFALGYLNHRGKMTSISVCKEPERTRLIREAIASVQAIPTVDAVGEVLLARRAAWFADEIGFISQHGFDLDGYRATDRFGRGARLNRELRPVVWAVREEYQRLRAEKKRTCDWDDVAQLVLDELAVDDSERMYRHVVIDEGQDFSPVMLRSLAAAIPEGGSLTFFGDMAQQICRASGVVAPSRPARARRRLEVQAQLPQHPGDRRSRPGDRSDADFTDVPDMVEPDEFEPSGPPPSLVRFDSVAEETMFVIERAHDAARTGSIGVLMRRHADEARFREAFRAGQRLYRNVDTWQPGPGISYGVLNSAKGYEFDQVFLIGLSDDYWPEPEVIRNEGDESATANDGRLLYVAVTRAKRELRSVHAGPIFFWIWRPSGSRYLAYQTGPRTRSARNT